MNIWKICKLSIRCVYLWKRVPNWTQGYFYVKIVWWWWSELLMNPRTPFKIERSAYGTRRAWPAVVRRTSLFYQGKLIIFSATLNGVRGVEHSLASTSWRARHGLIISLKLYVSCGRCDTASGSSFKNCLKYDTTFQRSYQNFEKS